MVWMLDQVGLKLEGRHHSGLDDSRNIGRIWIKMLEDGYTLMENSIKYLS